MNKGLTIRLGQCHVRRCLPRLLEHIRAGRIDAKGIITRRLPLESAPEGYRLFSRKTDGGLKVVLLPRAA